eukprot:4641051-Pyramimonas_sp.AAC.1
MHSRLTCTKGWERPWVISGRFRDGPAAGGPPNSPQSDQTAIPTAQDCLELSVAKLAQVPTLLRAH